MSSLSLLHLYLQTLMILDTCFLIQNFPPTHLSKLYWCIFRNNKFYVIETHPSNSSSPPFIHWYQVELTLCTYTFRCFWLVIFLFTYPMFVWIWSSITFTCLPKVFPWMREGLHLHLHVWSNYLLPILLSTTFRIFKTFPEDT